MDSFKKHLAEAIVGGGVFTVGALGGYLCARRGNGSWMTFVPYGAAGIGFSLGCLYSACKTPSKPAVAEAQAANVVAEGHAVSAATQGEPANPRKDSLLAELLPRFQKLQYDHDKMKVDITIDVSELKRKFEDQAMLTEAKLAKLLDIARSREQGPTRLMWPTDSTQVPRSYPDRNIEGRMTMQPFSKQPQMLSLATDLPVTHTSKRNPKDMSKLKIFEKPEGSEQESSEDVIDEMKFRV